MIDPLHRADALWLRLVSCSIDELAVIEYVLDGIELGRVQYGPLNLAADARNFREERAQEARDSLFYAACEYIAGRKR